MRTWGRALGLVAVVTGLLVAAAIASHAHPLWGQRGAMSSRTTDILMVIAGAVAAALLSALVIESRRPGSTAPRPWSRSGFLVALAVIAALVFGSYRIRQTRLFGAPTPPGTSCVQHAGKRPDASCPHLRVVAPPPGNRKHHTNQGGTRLPWLELGAILVLLTGGAVLLVVASRRPSQHPTASTHERDVITWTLNLSIDDLRREPDTRRAIIAAYARMEVALAEAGLPRRPSETPHEYLARSLIELDANADAASRLTVLFERAKFSPHESSTAMRDEAIDALIAVRDELTATATP